MARIKIVLGVLLVLYCGCLLARSAEVPSVADTKCKSDTLQLSRHARPSHYELNITIRTERGLSRVFGGQVKIHLEKSDQSLCQQSGLTAREDRAQEACDRKKIILHADRGIKVNNVTYEELESGDSNGTSIPVESVCRFERDDLLAIELSREPARNASGKLTIDYNGTMSTSLSLYPVLGDFAGVTRTTYLNKPTSKYKTMIITQNEPTNARKLLPCFDEPKHKATFELALEHPSQWTALSNMDPVRVVRLDGERKNYTRTYFARTPKMSSYLLAFALGEFDKIEAALPEHQMTIRVYTPPTRSREAQVALDVAVTGYRALMDYINVSQPIRKIDFVTSARFPGMMENWGLITGREDGLLLNASSGTSTDVHFTYYSIMHELAHQWFGNLVTMERWDNLWLKEGFASWLGAELIDKLYPAHDFRLMNLLSLRHAALVMDANYTECHSVKNPKSQTPDTILASYDDLTYQKGSAIIAMLNDYIGPENFKRGLRSYIRENQFKSTNETDLWRALSQASQLDLRELLRTWIEQPGFPLLSVRLSENSTRRIQVSQVRFGSPCDLRRAAWSEQTWVVPISLWVSSGRGEPLKVKFLLEKRQDEIELPLWFDIDQAGHWLKLNADFGGFYRVRYDSPKLRAALRQPVESKAMSPADRINLLEEAIGLAEADRNTSAEALADMTAWYKSEDNGAVIVMVYNALQKLEFNYSNDTRGLHDILIRYFNQNVLGPSVAADRENSASLVRRFGLAYALWQLEFADYKPAVKMSADLVSCCKNLTGRQIFERPHMCGCKIGDKLPLQLV